MNCDLRLVIGVDGGGTKTRTVLADDHGNVLADYSNGPSNLQNVGEAGVREVLGDAIRTVLTAAGVPWEAIGAFCLGAGGLDTVRDQETYERIVGDLLFPSLPREIVNDAFVALESGTRGLPGVAIIAGTGSIVAGRTATGRRIRVGGWGYLAGDEGSAFDIGRRGLMAALRAEDGRGTATAIRDIICEMFQIDAVRDLLPRLHSAASPPTMVAGLARAVDEAAHRGDSLALSLLYDAVEELVVAAVTGLRLLELRGPDARVVAVGGVFRSDLVRARMAERIREEWPDAGLVYPEAPPVAGAVLLGWRRLGIPPSDERYNNLVRALQSREWEPEQRFSTGSCARAGVED